MAETLEAASASACLRTTETDTTARTAKGEKNQYTESAIKIVGRFPSESSRKERGRERRSGREGGKDREREERAEPRLKREILTITRAGRLPSS